MDRLRSLLARTPPLRFFYALATVAATTLALLPIHSRLSIEVIALLFLLPVMLAAARWGLLPSLLASLAAFFAYNYFFLAPTFTLAVNNPGELLGLMVFLILAVLLSQSIGAANLHAAEARAREQEATTLYNLARALEAQPGIEESLTSVARWITEAFSLAGCEILVGAEGKSAEPRARFAASDRPPETWAPAAVDIPLPARLTTVGTLRLHARHPGSPPGPSTIRLLTTFAAQLGLFIERARLAREVGRAHLLEESDRLKSALLSSVSHDLRTPLAAIKASATVLLQEDLTLDPAARRDLLSAINEESDRLNRLVGDLLDQSRIEAGALRLKLDWCDLDELLRAAVRRHAAALAAFQTRLDLDPDLPLAMADYVQIDRVASNLLENAARFAPPGSVIEISAAGRPDEIAVSVSNAGPAIPPRLHPHLFDKFYRISEERSSNMGTGLGLSICKGIVEAHGGRIWVESPVSGKSGVRFVFTLPRRAPRKPEGGPDEEDKNPDRG